MVEVNVLWSRRQIRKLRGLVCVVRDFRWTWFAKFGKLRSPRQVENLRA